ncbi:penicillin-binding protein 3 [Cobetia sp. AM6]|nr:penicillin-binding protein 3 [Cobetia sp. AM6]
MATRRPPSSRPRNPRKAAGAETPARTKAASGARKSARAAMGPARYRIMLFIVLAGLVALVGRIGYLQLFDQQFLQDQGDARTLRVDSINAHRGMITDRTGEPLAISTPVITLWADPRKVPDDPVRLSLLARALGQKPDDLIARVRRYRDAGKGFMYIKRQMTPPQAQPAIDLDIPGVSHKQEYKRYYPSGEVSAQLIGVTNVDDKGQEGLELAYNSYLSGTPGKRRVLKDRKGRLVRDLHLISEAKPGGDLTLSIDLRLQYMAYRELKAAVAEHRADGGTLVMMDARTGEVLAMVNQKSYNPNNRAGLDPAGLRNRAITDAFEPGSVMKPLSMSAGLASSKYQPDSVIDTTPGYMRVDQFTIRDFRNYGKLDMAGILYHSSNIGMSRMALSLEDDAVWNRYYELGLGQAPGTGFPGETTGVLPPPTNWSRSKRASISYGYGISVSALQLASAYTALANDGRRVPPSLLKVKTPPVGDQVISSDNAHALLGMMEKIVQPNGPAKRAVVEGYRIAGKTGTVRKVTAGGYQKTAYRSLFAGVAPVSDPRIVTVVMIENPKGEEYYGGLVAAPVFGRVVGKALRLLDVPPDSKVGE